MPERENARRLNGDARQNFVHLLVNVGIFQNSQNKDRLDLSDRLAIAQTYVRFEGHHGLVTELAADYQTNLKQIYAILRDVEHGFAQKLPGPKPAEASRLLQRIATLEAQNQQLMRENTQLSVHQKRCVEVTAERLERLLLTGIGEILPYERRWSKSPMVWNMSPVWDVL